MLAALAMAVGTATTALAQPAAVTTSDGSIEAALAASAAGRHDEARSIIDTAIARAPGDATLQLRRSGILEAAAAASVAKATAAQIRMRSALLLAAADSAERYLVLAPRDAPNRASVRQRIDALRVRAAEAEAAAAERQPPTPAPIAVDTAAPTVDLQRAPASLRAIDAARDRRERNHQRRLGGGLVVGFGIVGAATGIALAADSFRLHYPTACSDADDATPCEDVAVRTLRARLGAGAATGLAAAVMMGVGTGVLARTPRDDDAQVTRRQSIGATAAGVVTLGLGLGALATAGALGARAARDFDAAATTDEAQLLGAVRTANTTLALGIAGVIVAASGAGLLAVPRPRRAEVAVRSAIGPRQFGLVLTGVLPW